MDPLSKSFVWNVIICTYTQTEALVHNIICSYGISIIPYDPNILTC